MTLLNLADVASADLSWEDYVRLLWSGVVVRYDCHPNALSGVDCAAFSYDRTTIDFPAHYFD